MINKPSKGRLSPGRCDKLASSKHILMVNQGAYPADQRCKHKLLQQRGENLVFHIFQDQWRRLLQQIWGGKIWNPSEKDVFVYAPLMWLIQLNRHSFWLTSAKRRPGFLGRYSCRKKTSIHNLLDTTQLFQMPMSELGYLLARSRNHIFLKEKKKLQLNVYYIFASSGLANVISPPMRLKTEYTTCAR